MQWKSNNYCIFLVCMFSLRYPACNAHVPCCHLWPLRFYSIFPHYLVHGTIFRRKKFIEHKMCVLIFSTTRVSNISRSKKNWGRYDQKCVLVFMWSTPCSPQILMKLEISRQIFEKVPNIKFHENPSSGSWVFLCGKADMKKLTAAFTILWKPLKMILQFHIKIHRYQNSRISDRWFSLLSAWQCSWTN